MAVKVIDTCAMIAFLEDEPGADIIEAILIDPANVCIAHAVNLSELYTHYCKYHTEADADEAVRLILEDVSIVERQDADGDFWKGVGRIRARITTTVKNPLTGGCHSISLADCFALQLAIKTTGAVVTCDHGEFDHVQASRICQVDFFR